MTTLPVLPIPNFNKQFVAETDASNKGLGAVLLQEGRTLAYFSRAISERA